MDAFDADVLIYAAISDHHLGRRVRALFQDDFDEGANRVAGVGSVLLLPELLSKPMREESAEAIESLGEILSRLDLLPLDQAVAELAVALGASHRLRAADAVHLATAVSAGADRFITNNRADFPKLIPEIAITHPDELVDPADH